MSVKVLYFTWKKDRIYEILNRCGVFSVDDRGDFNLVNNTLKKFEKFSNVFCCCCECCCVFYYGSIALDGKPFFPIEISFDYNNNHDVSAS